jgi:hypothetical protein
MQLALNNILLGDIQTSIGDSQKIYDVIYSNNTSTHTFVMKLNTQHFNEVP